jgi:hypothetical protein
VTAPEALPTLPVTRVIPVFVTPDPPRIEKLAALPREGGGVADNTAISAKVGTINPTS